MRRVTLYRLFAVGLFAGAIGVAGTMVTLGSDWFQKSGSGNVGSILIWGLADLVGDPAAAVIFLGLGAVAARVLWVEGSRR